MPAFILAAKDDKNDDTDCLRKFDTFDAAAAVRTCSVGPPDAPLVVLLGDSHADHYAYALRETAKLGQYRFWQLTVNSCLPMDGLIARERDCSKYADEVRKLLEKARPDLIVLSGRWTAYLTNRSFDNGEGGVENGAIDPFILPGFNPGSPAYANALFDRYEEGINDLAKMSERLLLIYPSPEAGWNVPERFAKSYTKQIGEPQAIRISTDWKRYKDRNAETIERLDRLSDNSISRFRSSDILCDTLVADRCLNAFDDNILYHDDDHFSNTGALFLKDALDLAIMDALRKAKDRGFR